MAKFLRFLLKIIKALVKFIIDLFRKKTNADSILIITNDSSSNPFGKYTEEVLKTEGFNVYKTLLLQDMTPEEIKRYSLVILSETLLTADQAEIIQNYVSGGGRLIAFRPDKQLAPVFGITDSGSVLADGYLLVDNSSSIGKGIVNETLQFHGEADIYALAAGQPIAILYTDKTNPTDNPAVVYNNFGSGQALAFTFDLNKSIIYTRQGNPSWAGEERDGIYGIRAADMFAGTGGNPNWIDSSSVHINQADEQMRLLSHAIEIMYTHPLPRLWYFPEKNKSLLIFTGDGEYSPPEEINAEINDVQSRGGNMTIYLINPDIDPAIVNNWISSGNEVAIHYDDTAEAGSPTYEGMTVVYDNATQNFMNVYGYQPHTVRNHWILWYGWSGQAEIELDHGHHLDCNYYHFDQGSSAGNFLGGAGTFTGSGLPMKFCSSVGNVLDIYQSETQLPDEQWGPNIYDVFKTMLDRSMYQGNFSVLDANFHPNRWGGDKEGGLKILDQAKSFGMPIWTAQKTLDFLQMKAFAYFDQLSWENNTLSFRLNAPAAGTGLTLTLPLEYQGLYLSAISRDGTDVPFTVQYIKGQDYAMVTSDSGAVYTFKAFYQTEKPGALPESMFTGRSGKTFADNADYELGTIFQTAAPGRITAVKVYGVTGESGVHTVRIWRNSDDTLIAGPFSFDFTGEDSWAAYILPYSVEIEPGTPYTVSVSTGTDPERHYTTVNYDFIHEGNNGHYIYWPANAGVFSETPGTRPVTSFKSNNYLRDIVFIAD